MLEIDYQLKLCSENKKLLITIAVTFHRVSVTRYTEYLSLFCRNAGKYGPEKIPYLATFHAVDKQAERPQRNGRTLIRYRISSHKRHTIDMKTGIISGRILSRLDLHKHHPLISTALQSATAIKNMTKI